MIDWHWIVTNSAMIANLSWQHVQMVVYSLFLAHC